MKNWLKAIRDLLVFIFPKWIIRTVLGKYDFAFVGHPLVIEDLARQYPNLKSMNYKFLKIISLFLWPVLGSEITGFRDNRGREVKGIVLFCPMSTRLLVMRRKSAIKKLIKIIKMAEKLNAKIVGLGAFVPIVTHDGKLLAKKTNLSMTTGTAFSSVIAVTNAIKLANACSVDISKCTVAIVGAGGSVGSICTRLLMDYTDQLLLIDKDKTKLDALLTTNYIKAFSNKALSLSTDIHDIKQAQVVIVTTNSPGTIIRSEHLRSGALIIDAAQPRNVSSKIPFIRTDVMVVESGVAEVPGLNTNFEFDLKTYSEVYSCLAEVLILLWLGIEGKQVGSFDIEYVYKLREAASKIGIRIPLFRNRAGFVTDNDIENFKRIALVNQNNFENGIKIHGAYKFVKLPV